MKNRRVSSAVFTALFLLSMAVPAWATMDNLKAFKQAYPGKDPTAYSCKACHQSAIGHKDDLNAYGSALKKQKAPASAKKLTVDDLQAAKKQGITPQ